MTAFELAQRYVHIPLERQGTADHPLIQWWLSLCGFGFDSPDETPWCSAFVNGIAWELRLPRSKSAAARSWLKVGTPIQLVDARPLFDIVILNRGGSSDPSATGPGHVTFFAGYFNPLLTFEGLGGNQSNTVTIAPFKVADILGVRRLA